LRQLRRLSALFSPQVAPEVAPPVAPQGRCPGAYLRPPGSAWTPSGARSSQATTSARDVRRARRCHGRSGPPSSPCSPAWWRESCSSFSGSSRFGRADAGPGARARARAEWRLRPRRVCPAPAARCGAPTVSVDDSSHLIHFALDVLAVGFLMKVGEEFLRTYPRGIAYTAAYVGRRA
jgi:hypothetical protein